MIESIKREQQNQVDKKYGVIRADEYKYYCPFCFEITQWTKIKNLKGREYSTCGGCQAQGSVQIHNCETCREKLHIYKDKGDNCSKCAKQLGPKNVINVKVLACLFCNGKPQTFYEYGIGLLMCTACENYRTVIGPHGSISEQYCSVCKSEQPELWRQGNKEQCKRCWKDLFECQKIQSKA